MALVESWKFRMEDVTGYLAGGGEHGVQIVLTADSKPATRPMCLNLEHYASRSCRNGRFVPRKLALVCTEKLNDASIRVQIAPYGDWRVRATIDFTVRPGVLIEARYKFHFEAAYQGFEAFISNYFNEPTEPYLHLNGVWDQPRLTDNEHRTWVRDAAAAENYRAAWLPDVPPNAEVTTPVDPTHYTQPVIVTPIAGSRQSIVNFAERADCPSVSANRRWNAHDLALVGRDVHAGETVVCRAWLWCATLQSLDDALQPPR